MLLSGLTIFVLLFSMGSHSSSIPLWSDPYPTAPSLPAYEHSTHKETEATPQKSMPRIALSVRLLPDSIPIWSSLFLAMSLSNDVDLFLSCWGPTPPDLNASMALFRGKHWDSRLPPTPLVSLKYQPDATYNSGRNLVASSIYEAEVARGRQYQYWVFGDADSLLVDCARCPSTRPPDFTGPACCADYWFKLLLSPHKFAVLGTMNHEYQQVPENIPDDTYFITRDCPDHKILGFHRDIVPVTLPYHLDGEGSSWWRSQFLMWYYMAGCAKGYTALAGRYFKVFGEQAGAYPRGSPYDDPYPDLDRHYPGLMFQLNMTVSNPSPNSYPCDPAVPLPRSIPGSIKPVHFAQLEPYKICLERMSPKFLEDIGKGVKPAPPHQ